MREILKNLYGVIKPLYTYMKFVIITGELDFLKVPLFSGPNQLQDITLNSNYSTIWGYGEKTTNRIRGETSRTRIIRNKKVVQWPFFLWRRKGLLHLSEKQFKPH
ncbi:MAG TPA: AAA family ATPase [Geminocystis sp. M7585_C2015_104]|nr:AAA family ATPase [Geminocystis sp. M7585_C2015_104]